MVYRLQGGCFCGLIRYRSEAQPEGRVFCHCTSCRRSSGAHAVAWFTVPLDGLLLEGVTSTFASSPGVRRGHCPRCGTTLTYWNAGAPSTIDVTVASLDDPAQAAPLQHIWMADAVAGDKPCDGLPQFARASNTA